MEVRRLRHWVHLREGLHQAYLRSSKLRSQDSMAWVGRHSAVLTDENLQGSTNDWIAQLFPTLPPMLPGALRQQPAIFPHLESRQRSLLRWLSSTLHLGMLQKQKPTHL